MNKMKYYTFIIFLTKIFYVLSPIPNWDLSAQSINLLTSSSYDYVLYEKNYNQLNVLLKKTITKTSRGITTQNYITIDSITNMVEFDDIGSQYSNKLGCEILICPRGKFHPYNFKENRYIIPPQFEDRGGWDLKCYEHDMGHFLIFYLSNNGKNLFYSYYNGDIREISLFNTYIYDFRLENGLNNNYYYFKFGFLKCDPPFGSIYLVPGAFVMNRDDTSSEPSYNLIGSMKEIIHGKNYIEASFGDDNFFHFLTYNNVNDFKSGYSNHPIDLTDSGYATSISEMTVTVNENSPFSFVDNVEIKEMKLIRGTKYAYYKIYNSNKDKMYYGLLDIKENKVLYNFEEEITSFLPVSSSEMLAITKTSAYKVCIIKSDSNCIQSCLSGNLILNTEGNKCQIFCDSGQVQLMPEGICINKDLCDRNYYIFNSAQTQCGLCSYFYPNGSKYKLVSVVYTTGCIGTIPNNADFYKEEIFLLKCKNNYYLNTNGDCRPEFCYENCASCSEISIDSNAQKCISCKTGFTLENGNCNRNHITPQTIIPEIIPSTLITTIPLTVPDVKCPLEKCLECNERSLFLNLCLTCNETLGYKVVNYSIISKEFVDCLKRETQDKKEEIKYYDEILKNIEYIYTSDYYNTSNLDNGNDEIIE